MLATLASSKPLKWCAIQISTAIGMENYLYRNAAKACNRKGTRNPGAYKKSRLARHVDQNTHEKNHQIHYERDENVRSPTTCVRKEHRTVGVTRREAKVLKNDSRNIPRTRSDWACCWGMGWAFVSLMNRLCLSAFDVSCRLSRTCPPNGGTNWLQGILGCLWRAISSEYNRYNENRQIDRPSFSTLSASPYMYHVPPAPSRECSIGKNHQKKHAEIERRYNHEQSQLILSQAFFSWRFLVLSLRSFINPESFYCFLPMTASCKDWIDWSWLLKEYWYYWPMSQRMCLGLLSFGHQSNSPM